MTPSDALVDEVVRTLREGVPSGTTVGSEDLARCFLSSPSIQALVEAARDVLAERALGAREMSPPAYRRLYTALEPFRPVPEEARNA